MTTASDEGETPPGSPKEGLVARQLRRGDLGFLPVIFALVAIGLLFQGADDAFLTPRTSPTFPSSSAFWAS